MQQRGERAWIMADAVHRFGQGGRAHLHRAQLRAQAQCGLFGQRTDLALALGQQQFACARLDDQSRRDQHRDAAQGHPQQQP